MPFHGSWKRFLLGAGIDHRKMALLYRLHISHLVNRVHLKERKRDHLLNNYAFFFSFIWLGVSKNHVLPLPIITIQINVNKWVNRLLFFNSLSLKLKKKLQHLIFSLFPVLYIILEICLKIWIFKKEK